MEVKTLRYGYGDIYLQGERVALVVGNGWCGVNVRFFFQTSTLVRQVDFRSCHHMHVKYSNMLQSKGAH